MIRTSLATIIIISRDRDSSTTRRRARRLHHLGVPTGLPTVPTGEGRRDSGAIVVAGRRRQTVLAPLVVVVLSPIDDGFHERHTGANDAECGFELAPEGDCPHRVGGVVELEDSDGVDADYGDDADSKRWERSVSDALPCVRYSLTGERGESTYSKPIHSNAASAIRLRNGS